MIGIPARSHRHATVPAAWHTSFSSSPGIPRPSWAQAYQLPGSGSAGIPISDRQMVCLERQPGGQA